MSSKRNLEVILADILEEIARIKKFTGNIKSVDEFVENEMAFYATLKCLENIGEAVKHIPLEQKEIYPIQWKKIAGLRDILVHEYFGIDEEIIWDVIQNKLSELENAVIFLMTHNARD
ncbi:HepT-like ribonuclease domain-containing protein [Thermodesulfatator atlanticus]|uniref:HepT-like ribonuclease domain-containing protein n=1 Tax=Thermodesulfatator atlanticus TaxID=501497 RepID=UPI0003B6BE2E|nr:DUF86 domain-containing protein [Thermodesulfatator atlanticus]